jgi:sulfur-oxidizing protein SoxY
LDQQQNNSIKNASRANRAAVKYRERNMFIEEVHMLRKSVMLISSVMIISLSSPSLAGVDAPAWDKVNNSFFSGKKLEDGPFIHIAAPKRAASGAQVPFAFSIDYPATKDDYIKSVTLVVPENPVPLTAVFHFTPESGKVDIATRIRLEVDDYVHVVAQTSDGRYFRCGGTVGGDADAARQTAGQMKLAAVDPIAAGKPAQGRLMIRHPMNTGLQRDLMTQGFRPAYFIKKIDVRYNDKPVMQADTYIGISEDPNFRFFFVPDKSGKLTVVAEDSDGKHFRHETDVKVQ